MFLNRLYLWTSVWSFAAFFVGCVAIMLMLAFVPLYESTEWMGSLQGPIVGSLALALFSAALFETEVVDAAAPTVTMNAGRISRNFIAALAGAHITVFFVVACYLLTAEFQVR